MKKMGGIISRVSVDRRMNMHQLSNQIQETRRNNVQNQSDTGMPRSMTVYSVDSHLIGETLQHILDR